MFGGNFAPLGWAFCDGSLLPISQYDALFALIGTTYGGDGQTTFALPDLRGRMPMHAGTLAGSGTYTLGQRGGTETVTLIGNQIPVHSHALGASSGAGSSAAPGGAVLAQSAAGELYFDDSPGVAMKTGLVAAGGGNQPHNNMSPYLVVSFIIALEGIFPSQG